MPSHFLIIDAPYYADIVAELVQGAIAELERRGATHERITVPGALEIPTALALVLESENSRRFHGFVLLGCIIRGETTHYDTVANESARAIMDLSVDLGLAVGNGILTVENQAQAWARARASELDKGGGAATAAFEMAALRERLGLDND